MATLTGQTIASSYEQLLSLPDGGGATTTLKAVTDGDAGTTFAMQLSTTTICIDNPTTSSSSQGGILRLQSDDGAVMASGHRLGVIEFGGAEDTSNTITTGARIEAITDATWSASENGADLVIYTTDGNAAQAENMRIYSDSTSGVQIKNTTADGSSEGAKLRLTADDGALMQSGSRLGVIEFAGQEGSSTITVGARIEAITDAAWSSSENGADMVFYTTDGNASQSEVLRLTADGKVGVGGDPSSTQGYTGILGISNASDTALVLHSSIGGTANKWEIGNNTSGVLQFAHSIAGTGSTGTKVVIDAIGNVGIGDTDPSEAKLSITGVASGDYGLYIDHDITDTKALYIDSEATTAPNMQLANPVTTTAAVVELTNASALTSGQIISLHSDSSSATARDLLKIYNENTSAVNATGLKIQQDAAAYALHIDHNADQWGMVIEGKKNIYASVDTSGGIGAYFARNLAESGSNPLVQVVDDHADNTQTAFKVHQDGAGYGIEIDQNGNQASIYIDSEATTNNCFQINAPTSNSGHVLNMEAVDALTTGSAIRIDAGGTTLASTAAGGLVEIMYDGAGTGINNLLFVKNDHVSAVNTVGIYVQQDSTEPAISATGGIVEQGGTLKENLLSNSGFDCWSNGTPVAVATVAADDAADDGTGDWTVDSSAGLAFDTNHYEFTSSASGRHIEIRSLTLTAGKLYRIRADMKDGTAAPEDVRFFIYDGAQRYDGNLINTTGSFVQYTAYIEAQTSTTSGWAGIELTASLSGGNFEFDDFIVTEITPGCVGANALAPDGWGKGTDADLWRQEHIDVGHASNTTTSYNGSYYGMKITGAAHSYQCFQSLQKPERFRGKTLTMGCWVLSSGGVGQGGVAFDNSGTGVTTKMTTGTSWEWCELTVTCSATGTYFYPALHTTSGHTVYFSQPICVIGSSIGEGNYTRPQKEIIYLEGECEMEDMEGRGFTTGTGSFALQSETRGKLGKNTTAIVNARVTLNDPNSDGANVVGYFYPGSGYENGFGFNIGNAGQTVPDDLLYFTNMSHFRTVGGGMTYNVTASGSLTLNMDVWIRAVEV